MLELMPAPLAAMRRWLAAAFCVGVLAACAPPASRTGPGDDGAGVAGSAAPDATEAADASDAMPRLRLPPAALGRTLDVQQRIAVEYRDGAREQRRELLALLQADARSTRLAAVAGGQVLARLRWDGQALQVTRAPWAPRELDPERILSDLQLSLWPVPGIAAALPPGWRIESMPQRRALWSARRLEVEVEYPDSRTTVLRQYRDGYRLTITTLTEDTGG
nr:DUF3261 domain-containing protein [Cupriavidus gilardii]